MRVSVVAIFAMMAIMGVGIILGANLPLLPIFDTQMHKDSQLETQQTFLSAVELLNDIGSTENFYVRELLATINAPPTNLNQTFAFLRDMAVHSGYFQYVRIATIAGDLIAYHTAEASANNREATVYQPAGGCVTVTYLLDGATVEQTQDCTNYVVTDEVWYKELGTVENIASTEPLFVKQHRHASAATTIGGKLTLPSRAQWGVLAADLEAEMLTAHLQKRSKVGITLFWQISSDKVMASDSKDYNPVGASTFDTLAEAAAKTNLGQFTGVNFDKLGNNSEPRGMYFNSSDPLHLKSGDFEAYAMDVSLGSHSYRIITINENNRFEKYGAYFTLVLVIVALIAFIAALAEIVIGYKIRVGSKNIVAISRQLEAATTFEGGDLEDDIDEDELDSVIAELAQIQDRFLQMKTVLNISAKYIPKEVITEFLMQGTLGLGMMQTSVTMLFIDIERFTSLCERLNGDDLPILLERYFEIQSNSILRNGGTIDKFIGDAIMVVWGAPSVIGDHNSRALATALQLKDQLLVDTNATLFTSLGVNIAVRIGVHSGAVMAGNMGCDRRVVYTVVGHNVVVASSLENVNKEFGTRICVSDASLQDVPESSFLTRFIGRIKVSNKPCTIYELVGVHPGIDLSRFSNSRAAANGEEGGGEFNDTASKSSFHTSKSKSLVAASESHVSSSHAHVKSKRLSRVATPREMMHETLKVSYMCTEMQVRQSNKYKEGIQLYIRGNFTGCVEVMNEYLEMCDPEDEQRGARKMIEHCESNMISPPAMDEWNGDIPTAT